ncbi:MAG: DUF924 family protein [Alphaproteobacteria bacterium]
MTADPSAITDILEFWFGELREKQWWSRDPEVDEAVRQRFGKLYEALAREVPAEWRASAKGCLAAVIALDQFPRNLFRNDARAYATDATALALAREAIGQGLDAELGVTERMFLYMPFQHSEDAAVQAESVALFERLGSEDALDFARRHKAVIDRFGRFPHRNAVLGRETTAEEQAFLAEHPAGF